MIPVEGDYFDKYVIEQMRLQRHDFMNYLQVIYGYIQINKPQEAINYIKSINKYMAAASRVYSLECDEFAVIFQEFVNKCFIHKIELELDIGIEYITCDNFSKDIDRKRNFFCKVTDKLLDIIDSLEGFNQILYIYIQGMPEDFNIIMSSEEITSWSDYFTSPDSETLYDDFAEDSETLMFYKKDGNIAIKLNFN